MIRDTYRGYEINIRREKCVDGSSFLSYTIFRVPDFANKFKSGLEFSGCTMPQLMGALKFIVDEVIADKMQEDEYEDLEIEEEVEDVPGHCSDCGETLTECEC